MKMVKRVWGLGVLSAVLALPLQAQLTLPGGSNSPSPQLDDWTFSDTNWQSASGQNPLALTNVTLGTNGDGGSSLLLDSDSAAYLGYPVVHGTHTNLIVNGSDGSFSFWFNPDWSTDTQGGTGPGA